MKSNPLAQPTFLVGSVRSGTTLLRLMLDHHPQITFVCEFEYVVNPMPPAGAFPTVAQFKRYADTDFIFSGTGLQVDPALSYPDLADSFLAQFVRRKGNKPIVGATVHENFDRLLRLWPNAKFIHLVRDPRDVARSLMDLGWVGNAWKGAIRWAEAERLWDSLCRLVPDDRRVEVTYECLVREPVLTLARLSEFMGAAYHPAMLEYPSDSTYGPPSTDLIEQWKRTMSERDVQLAEASVGDLLTGRGYAPSRLARITLTPGMERTLRRNARLNETAFRRQRYGAWLWATDLLSRRSGLRVWQARVKERLNAVDATLVK